MSSVSAETKQLSLLVPTFHTWKFNHRNTCEAFFSDFWNVFNATHVHITALVSTWLITNEVCSTSIIKFEEIISTNISVL